MPDYDPYDENPSEGGNTGTLDQSPDQGIAPPWWTGGMAPLAPGKTWADVPRQTDPQGNVWNFDPGTNAWVQENTSAPPPTAPPPATSAPAPGGSLIAPFTTPPPQTPGAGTDYIPQTPQFKGPPISKPDPFRAPSVEEALNDPGFKFRLGQGEDALQNWAAARGTLNDSGTAKALIDYGQGAASQEYGNVWDRAYNAYNTNNITQNVQPWSQAFQNANDITGYTTKSAANQYQTNADYLDRYNQWLSQFDIFRDQRDSTFDKQYKLLTS